MSCDKCGYGPMLTRLLNYGKKITKVHKCALCGFEHKETFERMGFREQD